MISETVSPFPQSSEVPHFESLWLEARASFQVGRDHLLSGRQDRVFDLCNSLYWLPVCLSDFEYPDQSGQFGSLISRRACFSLFEHFTPLPRPARRIQPELHPAR